MNPSQDPIAQTIVKLKEAAKDKVNNDIFHMLAMRKRARGVITVNGLSQRMKREGFKYSVEQYKAFLKLLGDAGLGTVVQDRYGDPRAVKDVKIKLQSIGFVALGGKTVPLKSWEPRAKYKPMHEQASLPKGQDVIVPPTEPLQTNARLLVSVQGVPVEIKFPPNLDLQEIAEILARLNQDDK